MKPSLKNILGSKYILLLLALLLYTASFIFNKLYSDRSSVAREVRVAERYLHHLQKDFNEFLQDTPLINRLIAGKELPAEFSRMISKPYSIFLYAAEAFGTVDMKFWNNQLVTPSQQMLIADDEENFYPLSNGRYFTIKKTFVRPDESGKVVAYAMIPVRSEFFIETDYLPQKFIYSNTADKRVMISQKGGTEFPVRSLSGKTLFYLDKKTSGAVPYNDLRTILLRMAALLVFFLFLHLLAESAATKWGVWKAVGLLVTGILIFRLLTYYVPSAFNLRQFELFNPDKYGSNIINRSLGDLFINAALSCWIVLFAWSKLHHRENPAPRLPDKIRWPVGIISLLLLILSTFMLAGVIKSLVADSKISFDVTDFFGLTIYTLIGFIVLACLSLTYYYFSQLLFRFIFPLFEKSEILIYFAIGTVGLIWLTLRAGHTEVLFNLPVLCWLLIYTWLANRSGVIIRRIRINIAGMLSWIFVFSFSIATIMLIENNKVEWEKRKRIADKFSRQTDEGSERLMSIAMKYLDNDFLQDNFYRFRDPDEGKSFRDSIITYNYSGYLNKYDTRLYVYDSLNEGLYNEDATTYETLNTILNVQSKPTKTEGLYYYETSFDKFNYITRRDVTDTAEQKMGSIFFVSNFKNVSRDALFPELFKQFKQTDPEESPMYSIAVYDSGKLVSPVGKYPFATLLTKEQLPREEFQRHSNGGYDELWYKASNNKVVVVVRAKETAIETITLFSYIFCSFLFLVALVQLISFILKIILSKKGIKNLFQLTIRRQVHSTIIFISVFSFLIIGIATISFFISRYNRNNSDKLSRTMKIMVKEMEKRLSDRNVFDDQVKIYDSVSNDDLQNLVNDVSDIHGVDVNVYDLQGDLQVSSAANVYTKGVLSKKIDPAAFYHLNRLRQVQYSHVETIGDFSFLSMYSPVRDEGNAYAYINIPYFTSKPELRQEISNFLVTIINLNAFIFLVAGLIALIITNRITRSFSLISDKMKEVNLGKLNEEIEWNRNDEIGDLVQEYNKMVTKLGESATALAKSEREGAWREMARQVAHEIKNPLTPMKLSIQYLQKAIANNQPNVKELSSNVASTLVEQIDHLSKIAADFSQFANIGNIHVEEFDLHDVIKSLIELYRPDQQVEIGWQPVNDRVMVNADKTQMNRLFTNLFTNAVEACRDNGVCRIEVNEKKGEDNIIISIKDNGEGIPPEMQSRIFMPNFTTKSSGTGLGLAMCKGIIEQAKGTIWFETEKGKGTTFNVSLPVS